MVSKMTKSGQDSNKEWSGLLQNCQENDKNIQDSDKEWSGK